MSLAAPWRTRPLPTLPRLPALDPRPRLRAALDDIRARVRAARLAESGVRSVLDAIAPDWTDATHPDRYIVGNTTTGEEWHTSTLILRDWPAHVAAGWLAPTLYGTEGDVSVAIHTTRLSKRAARRLLKTQRVLQTSVAQARAARGAIADPAEEMDLTSAAMLAPLVEDNAEALFSTSLVLTLRAPTAEALRVLVGQTRDALNVPGFGGLHWQQRAGFLTAGVPYAADRLSHHARKTLDTTTLAFSFPFLTSDVGTKAGPLVGISSVDRSPIHLDLWNREEGWQGPHIAIVGLNGGGKSCLVGSLLAEHATLAEPPDLIIIDPAKGDYRRFVAKLGGQVVRLGTGSPHSINAFDLPPAILRSGTGEEAAHNPVLTQARLASGLIALMVAEEGQALKKAERAAIETAILAAYTARGITAQDEQSWQASRTEVPVLPDVLAALTTAGTVAGGDSAAARSVAERLVPYCSGSLAGLFSAPTSLSLATGITSFDLENMDGELRPLAVWLLAHFIWQAAKRDRRKRVLALEEVRTLLAAPESARLVGDMFAMGRAYNLSVWAASQLLGDFTTTHEGCRAIDNAHTILHLRAAAGPGAQAVQERYSLSDQDRTFLETAQQGSGILITPKGHTRLEVVPSPYALWLMGGPEPAN